MANFKERKNRTFVYPDYTDFAWGHFCNQRQLARRYTVIRSNSTMALGTQSNSVASACLNFQDWQMYHPSSSADIWCILTHFGMQCTSGTIASGGNGGPRHNIVISLTQALKRKSRNRRRNNSLQSTRLM